ncbi:MAG: hemolysin III family protein [Bacteroidetes bacterium]|nr:hemolysin III family protein [Bacteroidota bacterium]MCW5896876.1 hemolysin III family protein [Bacteroidota bacterium]
MQNDHRHPFFREPVSGLTHAAGTLLSVAGILVLISSAAAAGKATHVLAFAVYGASLILLYAASALYHLLPVSEKAIAVLRRIDHMMIYILIAGTYTPVCLIVLPEMWGLGMLILIWTLAAAGILFTLFWMNAPRWLYTALYVAMGWSAAVAIVPLLQALPTVGLLWLLAGGVFYTGGAVMYAMKKPDLIPGWLGFHEIWHLFVMAGSFCHFMMMLQSILPMAG